MTARIAETLRRGFPGGSRRAGIPRAPGRRVWSRHTGGARNEAADVLRNMDPRIEVKLLASAAQPRGLWVAGVQELPARSVRLVRVKASLRRVE